MNHISGRGQDIPNNLFNPTAIETPYWESFVRSKEFSELSLRYSEFTKRPGIIDSIWDLFNNEFTWRNFIEPDLKLRAVNRSKKNYISFHIQMNNKDILILQHLMKSKFPNINFNWFMVSDLSGDNFIIGPKKGELSVGNLRSVANQIALRAKKLNLIYCSIVTVPTEAIIYILFSLLIATPDSSVICILPERFSSSLLASMHLFYTCFSRTYLVCSDAGIFIIGRSFLDNIKKYSKDIYSYLDAIIKNPDIIYPLYSRFDFPDMQTFIISLNLILDPPKKS